jgi:methyl-accepting chemotaxis protein
MFQALLRGRATSLAPSEPLLAEVAAAGAPMARFDAQGRLVSATPPFLALSADPVPGTPLADIALPEGVRDHAGLMARLAAPEPLRARFRGRTRHDGILVFEGLCTPVPAARGGGWVLLALDVTERAAQDVARENLLAALDDVIVRVDYSLDGILVGGNAALERAVGAPTSAMKGMPHTAFLFPEDAEPAAHGAFWDRLRRGEAIQGEFLRRGSKGEALWSSGAYIPVPGLDGRISHASAVVMNITEEKAAALDAIAKIEAIKRGQAVVEFDLTGRILAANDTFLATTGLSGQDVRGRHHRTLMPPAEAAAPAYVAFWDHLSSGGSFTGEVLRLRPDGTEVWLQATYTCVRDLAGRPVKVIKTASDITARKRAVAALSAAIAQLAGGDLTVSVPGPFTGDLEAVRGDFNDAVARLGSTISTVVARARALADEVASITAATTALSKRTEVQAADLERSAASLPSLSRSVAGTAAGAREAEVTARAARQRADAGRAVVEETVGAMEAIAQSSTAITRITAVLSDIAFQTNLLALNAGVEAARAGDSGRGFAVVAAEVRQLAQRSADASREIAQMIDASVAQVGNGVALVNRTGEALVKIAAAVEQIDAQMSAMADAASQQSASLSEINAAVGRLDQVTQQNVAMFEETSASTQALSDLTGDMVSGTAAFAFGTAQDPGANRRGPDRAEMSPASRRRHA